FPYTTLFRSQRQPELGPSGDAAFEISSIGSGAAKGGRGLLAYLMAMDTIDDDRATGRQMTAPLSDVGGGLTDSRHEHPVVGSEGRLRASIDNRGRRRRADGSV